MRRTYEFRIYPSKEQEEILNKNLEIARELYNLQINLQRIKFQQNRGVLSESELNNLLPDLKIIYPNFKLPHSQVLQNVNKRVTQAFKFFLKSLNKKKKKGYPRLKSNKRYKTITYPQTGFKILGKKIKISKIGQIKIKQHRKIKGKIKNLNIYKKAFGGWFVSFSVEIIKEKQKMPKKDKIGIDVGINSIMAFSDGRIIRNPRFTEQNLLKINIKNKILRRKKQ